MLQTNFNEEKDPEEIDDDISSNSETDDDTTEEEDDDDDDTDYDVLPSNGPGLAGDDGEQVIDEGDGTDSDE